VRSTVKKPATCGWSNLQRPVCVDLGVVYRIQGRPVLSLPDGLGHRDKVVCRCRFRYCHSESRTEYTALSRMAPS
jgi:hypothetical protein